VGIKPIVSVGCKEDRLAKSGERIIEFSFPGTRASNGSGPAKGYISFRINENGVPVVELYHLDSSIKVRREYANE
jgi:hypothetical protein